MNIVIASTYHYSTFVGGNEQHAHQLCLGLSRARHRVTYLSTSPLKQNDFPYAHIQLSAVKILGQYWLSKLPESTRDVINQAEILHVFGFAPILQQLLFVKNNTTARVMTYQADSNPNNAIIKKLSIWSQSLIPYTSDAIITTSKGYQTKVSNRWRKSTVVEIPPMIPNHIIENQTTRQQSRTLLQIDQTKHNILCVASLSQHHYYKGVDVLIRAFTQLPPAYHLHLIGDGDKISWYKWLAQSLGIDKYISFHGKIPNEMMSAWYKSVDLLVLPSISDSEGFGLSLIEAMYCETPCITTNIIGPAREYARKKLCVLIEPNNPTVLAKVIIMLSNKNSQIMVNRAKRWANSLTLEAMTAKTLNLYSSIKKSG
jgi:glycosyltransferase involved in cell wall biosynthesis